MTDSHFLLVIIPSGQVRIDRVCWTDWFESFCQRIFASRNGIVGVIEAYLDDSGTHDESPIIAVAGFFSTSSNWVRFSNQWQDVRRSFGVADEINFHMTDFENVEAPGVWIEPFSRWDKQKRLDFLRELISLVSSLCLFASGSVTIKKDFDETLSQEDRQKFGSMYSLCLQSCMDFYKRWSDETLSAEPVAYFAEAGNQYSAEMSAIFNETYRCKKSRYDFRLNSLAHVPKGLFLALEPADFLAYEMVKGMKRKLGLDSRPERKSMSFLRQRLTLQQRKFLTRYFDSTGLREILKLHPVHVHDESCWDC